MWDAAKGTGPFFIFQSTFNISHLRMRQKALHKNDRCKMKNAKCKLESSVASPLTSNPRLAVSPPPCIVPLCLVLSP